MNLNEAILNPTKTRPLPAHETRNFQLMGPPVRQAPKSRSKSLSKSSEPYGGNSYESIVLNSSSNKKSTLSHSTAENEEILIVALTAGRGQARCEVGMASIILNKPVLILSQTSDCENYTNSLTKLNILNPTMVIYPASFEKGNRLIENIRNRFQRLKLIAMPRKAFNNANGFEKLYQICTKTCFPLLTMIKNRYYAMAACSGLFTHLEETLFIFYSNQSINLEYQALEGFAIVDIATADRLELVCCNKPAEANKYSSLYGVMNRCLTKVGARSLRSIILQPLYSKEKIEQRLDCIEELTKSSNMLLSVQAILPKLVDVDQLLTLTTLMPDDPESGANRQLNYILRLNIVLDTLDPLKETLRNATQPFFVQLRDLVDKEDFRTIKNILREYINEEAYYMKGPQADQQRIWAIKPGINGLLDLVRKTYSERIEEMREHVKQLGLKYDYALTLTNNNKKGYHITMSLNQNQKKHMTKSDLPMEFIQVSRLANSFTMKTVELVNLSTRVENILTELFILSNVIIHGVVKNLKPYIYIFYKLVESVSYLDVLQSLAEVSVSCKWIRPKFNEYTEVSFSRHPLLEFSCQKTPIPNSVISCKHYNFHIITGPNGAGKSIFIRQVALLQIMAQSGCFVPAQSAIFRLADKIYARISNEDDMENNASTFVLEMREIKYILTTMTDKSLIIIDELCRSTSFEEGTAIAMAICDTLAKTKAYTYLTTHYNLLTKIPNLYFNAKVWRMQTVPVSDPARPTEMKFEYKFNLEPGATTIKGYGIYIIKDIWPAKLMKFVDELQEQYSLRKSTDPVVNSISKKALLRYDLECKVDKLKLQGKFTLNALNEIVRNYESEIEKLGDDDRHYSQNIIKQLHQLEGRKRQVIELEHSIFGDNMLINNTPITSHSEDDNENTTSTQAVQLDGCITPVENVISLIYLDETSPSIYEFQSIVQLEAMFDSDSAVYIEPEVNLSYDSAEITLNFTEESIDGDVEQFSRKLEINALTVPNRIANFSSNLQYKTETTRNISAMPLLLENCVATQVSTPNISFMLTENMADLDIQSIVEDLTLFAEEIEHDDDVAQYSREHETDALTTPNRISQSPFANFSNNLQDFLRNTSTPVHQWDANSYNLSNSVNEMSRNISATPVFEENRLAVQVSTPNLTFRLTENMDDLDIQSIVEDLTLFADEIEHDEPNEVDQLKASLEHPQEPNNEPKNVYNDRANEKNQAYQFSPKVVIRDGPNDPSSQESEELNREIATVSAHANSIHISTGIDLISKQYASFTSESTMQNSMEPNLNANGNGPNDSNIIHANTTNSDNNTCNTSEETLSYSPLITPDKTDDALLFKNAENSASIQPLINNEPNKCDGSTLLERNEKSVENMASLPAEVGHIYNYGGEKIFQPHYNNPNEIIEKAEHGLNPTQSEYRENVDRQNIIDLTSTNIQNEPQSQPISKQSVSGTIKRKSSTSPNLNHKPKKAKSSKKSSNFELSKEKASEISVSEAWQLRILEGDTKSASIGKETYEVNSEAFNSSLSEISKTPDPNHKPGKATSSKKSSNSELSKEKTSEITVSEASKLRNLEGEIESASTNEENYEVNSEAFNSSLSEISKTPDPNHKPKKAKSPKKSSNSELTKEKTSEITVSEASKLRNLEGETESASTNEENYEVNSEELSSSLSEISKQRNLDIANTSRTSSTKSKEHFKTVVTKKKFKVPLRKNTSFARSDSSGSRDKTSFTDISKMTQKEIRDAFYEQDRKFYEMSGNSDEMLKMWEEKLKRPPRPSVKQMQQATCLASCKRTEDGIEVTSEKKPKRKTSKKKKFFVSETGMMNMTIFSDRNAKTFEEFIKSDKDYKSFDFNMEYEKSFGQQSGLMFNFNEVNTGSNAITTSNTQTWTFVRNKSNLNEPSVPNNFRNSFSIFAPTGTPEGYLTRNRSAIVDILNKYK